MATQKVRPDQGRDDRQQVQRRQVSRMITLGALAIAAIAGALAVLIAVVAVGGGEQQVLTPTGSPTVGVSTASASSPTAAEGPYRFRPDGSEPAAPEHGKHGQVVMSETSRAYPPYAVYVFADGRVIFQRRTGAVNTSTGGWLVRRLTPMGIDLLQPGAKAHMGEFANPKLLDPFGLPAGAWKDPAPERYRVSRYAVCPNRFNVRTDWRQLPARARELFDGSGEGYIHRCVVVTNEDVHQLDQVLSRTDGVTRDPLYGGSSEYGIETESGIASVGVYPILPNATWDRVCSDLYDDC